MTKIIKLSVNGRECQLNTDCLSEVLITLGFDTDWLATAVNGELVRRDERQQFKLHDGDKIEVLSPMQGG